MRAVGGSLATEERQNADQGFRPHVIAALALALIPAFVLTAIVARAYKAEQRDLATH